MWTNGVYAAIDHLKRLESNTDNDSPEYDDWQKFILGMIKTYEDFIAVLKTYYDSLMSKSDISPSSKLKVVSHCHWHRSLCCLGDLHRYYCSYIQHRVKKQLLKTSWNSAIEFYQMAISFAPGNGKHF
jgi:hypothetical protein